MKHFPALLIILLFANMGHTQEASVVVPAKPSTTDVVEVSTLSQADGTETAPVSTSSSNSNSVASTAETGPKPPVDQKPVIHTIGTISAPGKILRIWDPQTRIVCYALSGHGGDGSNNGGIHCIQKK